MPWCFLNVFIFAIHPCWHNSASYSMKASRTVTSPATLQCLDQEVRMFSPNHFLEAPSESLTPLILMSKLWYKKLLIKNTARVGPGSHDSQASLTFVYQTRGQKRPLQKKLCIVSDCVEAVKGPFTAHTFTWQGHTLNNPGCYIIWFISYL